MVFFVLFLTTFLLLLSIGEVINQELLIIQVQSTTFSNVVI